MDREAASSQYKWNLEDIYSSQQDWEKDYQELLKKVETFSEFRGKFSDKKELAKYHEFNDDFSRKFMNLYLYSYLGHDVNLKDSGYQNNLIKMNNLSNKLGQVCAYISPEMASLDNDYLTQLMNDEQFKDYKLKFESIIMNKKHVLSEKEEAALATTGAFVDGFSDVYDTLIDTELTYDSFTVDGKEYPMSEEKYSKYMDNDNREVRRKAYDSLYAQYKKYARTFTKLYTYHVKMCGSDLNLRKYDSYLSAALEGSKIPKGVYYKLIEKVSDNVEVIKSYFALVKEQLGLEDFAFYDTYTTISELNKEYDQETQFSIVKKALEVLGEEYQKLLQEAHDNNWMDVYPSDTKASGGYQFGSYDTHPFVLLNNTDNYTSMSTMAHELGHAMHSYYSNKNQPYPTHNYAIYVAEVASTVNEILLNRYMIENSQDIEEKIFFIDKYIKNVKATVFRQTMFSEFEEKIHRLIQQDVPLGLDEVKAEYHKLIEKHFGGVVNIDENIDYEWIRISHFYRPFYVYKYATSYTCANYIASCILADKNDMKKKYFDLLKSGGSDWPDNILKKVGVDLESDAPYDMLFDDLKKHVELLKELLAKRK